MIKLFAAIFMVIDHIGVVIFSEVKILRIIGRISMPFFAYCVGRGFYYSQKNGHIKKYIKNLFIFSLISQIPFTIIVMWDKIGINNFILNIGFTWLFSVLLLKSLLLVFCDYDVDLKKKMSLFAFSIAIVVFAVLGQILDICRLDYDLFGILLPIIFYFFMFKIDSPVLAALAFVMALFIRIFLSTIGYIVANFNKKTWLPFGEIFSRILIGDCEMFAVVSFFLLIFLKRYDDRLRLPRKFFYWLYPAHLSLFLIARYVMEMS